MLKKAMHKYVPEIDMIVSINNRSFEKSARGIDYGCKALLVNERCLWPAFLCLLSAKTIGSINILTINLGCIMHLLSITMHLHGTLPKKVRSAEYVKKIQLPVLTGDLLYSRIFADISRYGLEQCLPLISSLICTIHERFILPEYSLTELEGMLYEAACWFGVHSVTGNIDISEKISEVCGDIDTSENWVLKERLC